MNETITELDGILVNLYLGANTTEKQPNWQAQMKNPELAEAKQALLAWSERREAAAEVRTLKNCYIDQDEIYVKFNGGFVEQYERIKQLTSDRTGGGEGQE